MTKRRLLSRNQRAPQQAIRAKRWSGHGRHPDRAVVKPNMPMRARPVS